MTTGDLPPTRLALTDEPVGGTEIRVSRMWDQWFRGNRRELDRAAQRMFTIEETGKNAALGATAFPIDPTKPLNAGLYRATTFLRVTTAAGTSSSVAVTLRFVRLGVACSFTLTTLNANAVNAPVSDTRLMHVDAKTVPTYETTYASTPGGMVYELFITFERVDA